jgi:hypothetical protein
LEGKPVDALPETWFRLSPPGTGTGVSCGKDGVFVGPVPLLERLSGPLGTTEWRPRPIAELDDELSKYFDLPIEFTRKMSCLAAVARALDRGDIVLAQIATLQLQIPDPPSLSKSVRPVHEIVQLAERLQRSGLLKAGWDPAKHPRWPAGSPNSIGGQFAPQDSGSTNSESPPVTPVDFAIPVPPFAAPFRLPVPVPRPFEIVPPPLDIPNVFPRGIPKERDEDCDQEWAEAAVYCQGLIKRGQLGRDGYRGMGKTLEECMRANVSARCGGDALKT